MTISTEGYFTMSVEDTTDFQNLTTTEFIDGDSNLHTYYDFRGVPIWAKTFLIGALCCVAAIGIPANLLMIIVQYMIKNKHSVDYFVMNLAGFELLCSTLDGTLNILRQSPIWPLLVSKVYCKIFELSSYIVSLGPGFLLVAIAVDRYFKICHPLKDILSVQRARYLCVGITVFTFAISVPSIPWNTVTDDGVCASMSELVTYRMYLASLTFISFILLCLIYTRVILALRSRHQKKRKYRENITTENKHVEPTAEFDGEQNQDLEDTNTNVSVIDKPENDKKDSGKATTFTPAPDTLRNEQEMVTRVTRIVFLTTLVYLTSYLLAWVFIASGNTVFGPVGTLLAINVVKVNCISNPIFFFAMSSNFRRNVKSVLSCRKL